MFFVLTRKGTTFCKDSQILVLYKCIAMVYFYELVRQKTSTATHSAKERINKN